MRSELQRRLNVLYFIGHLKKLLEMGGFFFKTVVGLRVAGWGLNIGGIKVH